MVRAFICDLVDWGTIALAGWNSGVEQFNLTYDRIERKTRFINLED